MASKIVANLFLSQPTYAGPKGESHPPATQGLAEVGCDRHMDVGGDTRPRVPHTSHVFDEKEKLVTWANPWLFGALMGSPWIAGGWDSPH